MNRESSQTAHIALICLSYAIALSACATRPGALPAVHRGYYGLLEGHSEQRAFLEMDERARQAYADQRGFSAAWERISAPEQQAALAGRVEVGTQRFAVHMAWGRPADEKLLKVDDPERWLETYIQCTSGPRNKKRVHDHLDCDGRSRETQLLFENGRLVEIRELD